MLDSQKIEIKVTTTDLSPADILKIPCPDLRFSDEAQAWDLWGKPSMASWSSAPDNWTTTEIR
jgi:hypothetical protein